MRSGDDRGSIAGYRRTHAPGLVLLVNPSGKTTMNISTIRPVVLAIDDNVDTHRLLAARLGSDEFNLKSAMSFPEADTMMRTFRPGAILLDLDMPGVDGFEALRILKGRPDCRSIPVIVMTGMSSGQVKARVMELGAADFIGKPFNPAELKGSLRNALRLTQLLQETSARAADGRKARGAAHFIKFSMADYEFATALDIRLRAKGLTAWFAPEDVGFAGKAMFAAMPTPGPQDRTIAVLSDTSLGSGWLTPLVRREMTREQGGGQPLLFAVRLASGEAVNRWMKLAIPPAMGVPGTAGGLRVADFSGWHEPQAFEHATATLLQQLSAGSGVLV